MLLSKGVTKIIKKFGYLPIDYLNKHKSEITEHSGPANNEKSPPVKKKNTPNNNLGGGGSASTVQQSKLRSKSQ